MSINKLLARQADKLSLENRAKFGLLPDELDLWDILRLIFPGEDKPGRLRKERDKYIAARVVLDNRRALGKEIIKAIESGQLKATERQYIRCILGVNRWLEWKKSCDNPVSHVIPVINRSDFKAWLEREAVDLESLELLKYWYISDDNSQKPLNNYQRNDKQSRIDALNRAWLKIEEAAISRCINISKDKIPGRKARFHKLLSLLEPDLAYIDTTTLSTEYLRGEYKLIGNKDDLWSEIFPGLL